MSAAMDVQAMLAQIQENHQAALRALSIQVHTLRDTCDLQEKEIELLRQAHTKDNTKALLERMLLRRLLEDARTTVSSLGETVTLLNHELQIKSREANHDDHEDVLLNGANSTHPQTPPPIPHTLLPSNSRDIPSPAHSSASAPSRISLSQGLPQHSLPASPSSIAHYDYETDNHGFHAPIPVEGHRGNASATSSSFELTHSSYRKHDDAHSPFHQLSPTTSTSPPASTHRRRRRLDSRDHILSTTTVDTSMDLSFPWTSSKAIVSPKPRPRSAGSSAPLVPPRSPHRQHRNVQVYSVRSESLSPRPQPQRRVSAPSDSHSKWHQPASLPISSSSRLDQELKNLRAKLHACSRSSGS